MRAAIRKVYDADVFALIFRLRCCSLWKDCFYYTENDFAVFIKKKFTPKTKIV